MSLGRCSSRCPPQLVSGAGLPVAADCGHGLGPGSPSPLFLLESASCGGGGVMRVSCAALQGSEPCHLPQGWAAGSRSLTASHSSDGP